LEFHGLDKLFPSGRWSGAVYKQLKQKLEERKISRSLEISFGVMFKELENLRQLKKELLLELRNLSKSDRYRKSVDLLKSAPGIGMVTAIRLALEWGDMSRFQRKEAFASFLGLIPSDYSTGELDRRGHITKQGNQWVRSWLVEAAWRAIKYDPVLLNKFRRVHSHSGSKKKAIVAVARMLAMRLRRVLLDAKPYEIGLVSS
jgi:transposase